MDTEDKMKVSEGIIILILPVNCSLVKIIQLYKQKCYFIKIRKFGKNDFPLL